MRKIDKDYLYNDLKSRILSMDLSPDEDLDETALTKIYGLSRTPVREALHRLAGEGYIVLRTNKAARVAPMNCSTIRNFFLVAPMIYATIGRLAAQNFKLSQMADLVETQERFRSASLERNFTVMSTENNRFHEIMGEMSNNIYLMPTLERLLIDHARIGHTFYRPQNEDMEQRLKRSVEHHDGFIEAIRARDEAAVVDLVFEHWELSRENMELYIAPERMHVDTRLELAMEKSR